MILDKSEKIEIEVRDFFCLEIKEEGTFAD